MNIDIAYLKNYIRSDIKSSGDLQNLSDRYSQQYNEAISKFQILINSDRADIIYKDNTLYKCIVDYGIQVKHTNLNNQYIKEIWTKHSDAFKVGDVVQFENKVSKEKVLYLFIEGTESKDGHDVFFIQRCNNALLFYHNNIPYSIPCIISSQISLNTTLSADTSKYITELGNEIFVRVGKNSETDLININDKFKIGRWNYEVQSISDIVENGLYVLKMSFIADEVVLPTYAVEILNGNSIQVNENDSLTINAVVKADGVIVSPTPSLVFSSSDITKATINSTTGVVTILDVGSVVFTCKLASNLSVLDTISVEIVEVPVENKTVTIDPSGSISIIKNNSSNYSCVFKNNGIVYTDTSIFYLTADDGISETTLAQITSQDGVENSCVVKGLGLGCVKLWVKNVEETVVSDGFRIQIKNIF